MSETLGPAARVAEAIGAIFDAALSPATPNVTMEATGPASESSYSLAGEAGGFSGGFSIGGFTFGAGNGGEGSGPAGGGEGGSSAPAPE